MFSSMPVLCAPDGTKLAYRVLGEGTPLVCLPGGPMQDSAYLGELGGLSRRRQLILFDLRGTGRSQPPADTASDRCDSVVACAPPEEADAPDGNSNMILPKVRDRRFVTVRRGGSLADSDHHLLALWAASCAEHVLDLFESAQPQDTRPRQAIEHARAWVRGEVTMTQARAAGGRAMGAARDLRGAARHAAYAAGQAGAVAHVAAHELGAAAYAIKAARAAAPEGESEAAGRLECRWQRDQLPEAIGALVLDDQRLRNEICWSVFDS